MDIREQLILAYREYRALMIFGNQLTPAMRQAVDRQLAEIETVPLPLVEQKLPEVKSTLADLRVWLGATAELKDFENLLVPGDAPVLFLMKHAIERLCSRYDRVLSVFPALPPHARIGIDILGTSSTAARRDIDFHILEALLFEDMAFLWNLALAQPSGDEVLGSTDVGLKRQHAVARATAKAAFNFVEGYLNTMAMDVLIETPEGVLSQKEIDQILEEDYATGRRKLLTLRDKLLQYPRMAAGAEHPPLQESNCKEMAYLLEQEENLRHALIHPTIRERPGANTAREQPFFRGDLDEIAKLVDASIALVERCDAAIGSRFGGIALWLRRRGSDGRFSQEIFK